MLLKIFVETLGYTINPDENYNLTTEYKNQINQTDNEIDRMVYELYELTEEEIEIVENLVK